VGDDDPKKQPSPLQRQRQQQGNDRQRRVNAAVQRLADDERPGVPTNALDDFARDRDQQSPGPRYEQANPQQRDQHATPDGSPSHHSPAA
jgi:hypothetical protein